MNFRMLGWAVMRFGVGVPGHKVTREAGCSESTVRTRETKMGARGQSVL